MALFTPTNQKRLTNITVVRTKKCGERFEIACYPNKVRPWRERLETNLGEVLQSQAIFNNVSQGKLANKKELLEAFGTDNESKIAIYILENGDIQMTEKERNLENQTMYRDVAKFVAERCINLENNRQFTITMIEKMMKDCHINLKANKSSKQHGLEVIKQLCSKEGLSIAPAMLEVVIKIDEKCVESVKPHLLELIDQLIRFEQVAEGFHEMTCLVEPKNYRTVNTYLQQKIKGRFCVEIIGRAKHAPDINKGSSNNYNPIKDLNKKDNVVASSDSIKVTTLTETDKFEGDQVSSDEVKKLFNNDSQGLSNHAEANPTAVVSCKADAPVNQKVKLAGDSNKKKRVTKKGKKKRNNKDDDWPDDSDDN